MFYKICKFILVIFLVYQNPLHSKSISFDDFKSRDLSNYFSGIVAFQNTKNSDALKFFNSSKNLIEQHDPYLKRFITTLILDQQINRAINIVKKTEIIKIQIFLINIYYLL